MGTRLLTCLTAAVALLSAPAHASADTVAGQVLVRYAGDSNPVVEHVANAAQAVAALNAQDGVVYAEPVYRTRAQLTPPNSGFGEQWDLRDATQVSRAWNLTGAGAPSVLVANVDSGVNFSHPALAGASLWSNAGEIAGNGLDDDGDGCVDDVNGCDFVDNDGDPSDENGHGTATAGIVDASWNAGVKYAGVAPGTSLIAARALDASGAGTTAQLASALDYVADHGARVINVSITGPESQAVNDAIASHPDALFVAAAGNAGADDDDTLNSYPCANPAPNVLCVGATDQTGALASFSNFGATSVDLAAPGVKITTLSRTGYSNGWSGTSIAAPIVAGVAALAYSAQPGATVAQVKAAILGTADPVASLTGKTVSGGKLNAYAAISALTGRTDTASTGPEAPAPPTGPTATAPAPTPVAPTASGTLTVAGKAVAAGKKAITVKVSCAGTAGCSGTLSAAGGKRGASFSLHPGSKTTITVPATLSRKTKKVALVLTARETSLRLSVKLAKR